MYNDSDYCGSDVNSVLSPESIVSTRTNSSVNTSLSQDPFQLVDKNGLKCLYTSADSISNKWSELETLVHIHQPDIIGLTEAFPKNQETNNDLSGYVLQGYQTFYNEKFIGRGNRGTLLLMRDCLEVSEYKKLNNKLAKEACWCELQINNLEKVLIGNIYRSPNSSVTNSELINDMIRSLNNESHCKIVIMGDFNYREIDWEHWMSNSPENHISHQFIEAIRDSFLHQHVELCTRFRENQSPSLLDLVFSSDELLVNNIEYLSPVGKSDHRVMTFSTDCMFNCNIQGRQTFAYDRGDYAAMCKELSMVDWKCVFEGKTVNDNWIFFRDKLKECTEENIPVKSHKSNGVTRKTIKPV